MMAPGCIGHRQGICQLSTWRYKVGTPAGGRCTTVTAAGTRAIYFTGAGSTNTMTRVGWTAGAGLEYALTNNWSVRAEYDYLGFGSKQLNFTTPALGTVSSNADLNVQEVKAGFDYKFGP